jgi:NAD(P)-dependent dehydrogenase (short-subunit alcohol dehydrogenase family)
MTNTLKSVVITGASTGIGAACAIHLAGLGFRVFAGVRKPADGETLTAEGGSSIIPLLIDVTDEKMIGKAAETVRQQVGESGLYGLVNNAGIAVPGPLEYVPVADFRRQIEVNLIGQVAVTQAFLPLIRTATGRIVNISSVGGLSSLPFFGPYNASKFGLEAISDSLRVELLPWGIHLAVIEPGAVKTPIWAKSAPAEITDQFPPEAHERYGPVLKAMPKIARKQNDAGIDPLVVARSVEHALLSPRPRLRYVVGGDTIGRAILEILPGRWRDRLILSQLPKFGPQRKTNS